MDVGSVAPAFTLPGTLEEEVTLAGFRGAEERCAGLLPDGQHRRLNAPTLCPA